MTRGLKTIQIILPHGEPRGIRKAEFTTGIAQVIDIPKMLLADFLALPKGKQIAIYFLIETIEHGPNEVYIGQTGELNDRLAHHDANRDWERALVVVPQMNSMTETHAEFLEWDCIAKIKNAARYKLENGNDGRRPHMTASTLAECSQIFDTANVLLSTLGYSLFSALKEGPEKQLFRCKDQNVDAKGSYSEEGFVVLKGSTAVPIGSEKIDYIERDRKLLVDSKILKPQGGFLVFQENHLFKTPSKAAIAILGRIANGNVVWRNETGRSLKFFAPR